MKHSNLKAQVFQQTDGQVVIRLWNPDTETWEERSRFFPVLKSGNRGPFFVSTTLITTLFTLQEQGYRIQFA